MKISQSKLKVAKSNSAIFATLNNVNDMLLDVKSENFCFVTICNLYHT